MRIDADAKAAAAQEDAERATAKERMDTTAAAAAAEAAKGQEGAQPRTAKNPARRARPRRRWLVPGWGKVAGATMAAAAVGPPAARVLGSLGSMALGRGQRGAVQATTDVHGAAGGGGWFSVDPVAAQEFLPEDSSPYGE